MRTLTAVAVVGLLSVGACAKADKLDLSHGGGHPDGGLPPHPDSSLPQIDSFVLPDAPPGVMSKTLSQTTLDTLTALNSAACLEPAGLFGTPPGTSENHYFRVFDLASFGINTDFNVSAVSFQVEDCETAGGNGTLVNVYVGSYSGTPGTTLSRANMTKLATSTGVQVPEVVETATSTPGATINVPIVATIPAGGKVYVEIESPDGANDHYFYLGSNTGGESAPGYIAAPKCTSPGNTPTSVNSLGLKDANNNPMVVNYLITLTGTY